MLRISNVCLFFSSFIFCWFISNFVIFHQIKVLKHIWDQCCHLMTETGSWYPLIANILYVPLHSISLFYLLNDNNVFLLAHFLKYFMKILFWVISQPFWNMLTLLFWYSTDLSINYFELLIFWTRQKTIERKKGLIIGNHRCLEQLGHS
jgi:hypothetical protein